MDILIGILVLLDLVILRIFHTSHAYDDGVPLAGCENRVYFAEGLIVTLVLGLMKLIGVAMLGRSGVARRA